MFFGYAVDGNSGSWYNLGITNEKGTPMRKPYIQVKFTQDEIIDPKKIAEVAA